MVAPVPAKPDEEKEEVIEEGDEGEETEGEAVEGEAAEGEAVAEEVDENPVLSEALAETPAGMMPAGASRRSGDVNVGGYVRVRLPDKKRGEMFGIADALQGGSRLKVNCEDGRSRMGRIPGKLKRRMWMREGDLVIVRPWDFQKDKCDVVFRYTKTQASYLSRRGMVPKTIDIF